MTRWSVVVPVKRLEHAKTRLRATLAVSDGDHRRLVLAMAEDTIAAAFGCAAVGQVVVVTDDVWAGAALRRLGAVCVADTPDAGLNPALVHGALTALRRAPGLGVAVLAGDLPALRPAELAEALAAATAARRGFVADLAGTGTTLLATVPDRRLAPAYGLDSAAAHALSGAVRLGGDWPSLRQDVDTADDLARAVGLGVGPHVACLLPALSLPAVPLPPPPAALVSGLAVRETASPGS